jgi:hypothetical protein
MREKGFFSNIHELQEKENNNYLWRITQRYREQDEQEMEVVEQSPTS